MQDVELPCDWTVNRRPNNAAAVVAPPPHTAPTATTDNNNNKKKTTNNSNPPLVAAEGGLQPQPLVLPHPLGPRSRKTAVFSTLLPNHGQVKTLVLQHLLHEEPQPDGGGSTGMDNIVVENLLSRLPYKKMLSDMFGGTLRGTLQNAHIPYATRAYEESFMREVQNPGERECARGQQCECMFIDRQQPFVGVEFLLPSEQQPPTPHLCVLCCRAITQQLYYDVMFDKADFPGVIQRFGNIHSEPGEYSLDAMLIAAPSAPVHVMPLPIVSHQRNRYLVYVHGGIKRLKQTRVYFQITPSCNADSG